MQLWSPKLRFFKGKPPAYRLNSPNLRLSHEPCRPSIEFDIHSTRHLQDDKISDCFRLVTWLVFLSFKRVIINKIVCYVHLHYVCVCVCVLGTSTSLTRPKNYAYLKNSVDFITSVSITQFIIKPFHLSSHLFTGIPLRH